jgi:hypothetical protein
LAVALAILDEWRLPSSAEVIGSLLWAAVSGAGGAPCTTVGVMSAAVSGAGWAPATSEEEGSDPEAGVSCKSRTYDNV